MWVNHINAPLISGSASQWNHPLDRRRFVTAKRFVVGRKKWGLRVRVGIQQSREAGQITRDICSRLRDVSDSQLNEAGEPTCALHPWQGTHNKVIG